MKSKEVEDTVKGLIDVILDDFIKNNPNHPLKRYYVKKNYNKFEKYIIKTPMFEDMTFNRQADHFNTAFENFIVINVVRDNKPLKKTK